jgi:glycosyltransferase involved in cell wall biosynthesis
MRKKRICLVIPSLYAGGMERVMSELAGCFCENPNIDVHIILYGINPETFYKLPEQINIHKHALQFDSRFRFWTIIKTMIYLRGEIKKIKPDSVLSFGEYWNSFVLLSLFGTKFPLYVSDRSQPDKSLGRFHDRLRKWLYPKTAGVILQTEKAKYIYQKNIKKLNIKVIGNPIREILSQTDIQKQNQVLMVSRLIKSKHHDHLIKIFASINKKDWKLVLVGNDHLKQSNMESLKQLASDCGVADRVVFAGTQSDVEKYYLSSKIFAFTSSSEGFPNAIGEAMSAGLPVVAYDCIAGPSEMISDGENGYLVPVFDDIMFQEKLHKLMMDEALRKSMGENAKKSIRKFSVELIGKQFIDFILK